jgi:hypothetical protein
MARRANPARAGAARQRLPKQFDAADQTRTKPTRRSVYASSSWSAFCSIAASSALKQPTPRGRSFGIYTTSKAAADAISTAVSIASITDEAAIRAASRRKPSGNSIAPTISEFLSRVPRRPVAVISTPMTSERRRLTMTKPTSTEKVVPITVGNPASAASFVIDQSHMEDFTEAEEKSSVVEVRRPPKGTYFTVLPEEKGKPMVNRGYFFLLEIPGCDPYLVTPEIAKEHSEEDVIRPILFVRYVTMLGEEALWPIKLTPPDSKSNSWNTSALNIVEVAASGKWVRIVSKQKNGQYRHTVSPKNFEQEAPKFSKRSLFDLIDAAFPNDQKVTSNDHEVWTILKEGSTR